MALLWQRDRARHLSVEILQYKTSHLKTLSCGIICVILRLAVLIQYQTVTHTHTHTHRVHADGQIHDDCIYRT